MISAELALAKTFFDLMVARDNFESPDAVKDIANVLMDVDDQEAEYVAASMCTAIRSVLSDATRLRSVTDAAVQLDMFEVIPAVVEGVERFRDPHQLANLASLLANPASVSDSLRSSVQALLRREGPAVEALPRMVNIRLGSIEPQSDLEHVLAAQVWPGRYSIPALARTAPQVYVSADDAPPQDYWRVIGALAESGVRVRRVSSAFAELPVREWATDAYPLVCWTGHAVGHWRDLTGFQNVKTVMVTESMTSKLALPRLMNAVRHQMPPGAAMRTSSDSESTFAAPAFSVETLHEGAFDHLEMMYLGAASRSVLRNLSKDALQPRDADVSRWTFDQLVTLRLVQGVKTQMGSYRADPKRLLRQLREIATANERSRVALDANGEVYVDDGTGFRTLKGNQDVIPEVLTVDDAFRPFTLGGGIVPDLFHPAHRTAVDPRILAGTPTVRDRRISARAISQLHAKRGMDVLRSAFTELDAGEIQDALKVGRAILAHREVA